MFSTFGMSGQWANKPGKHPCFGFYFEDNSEMHFNDPRHFGTIKFTNKKQDLIDKLDSLGWDPFTPLTEQWKNFIYNKLQKSNKTICEDLMSQEIFSGVGNYIKNESLYQSMISPWRKSKLLLKNEINILCSCIINIMNESYSYQGATISTYNTPYGEEGKYSSFFRVYSKKLDPNGLKITKEKTPDGRSTYWVSSLQK
jgi:formamidopyrimidine-DNA glycosylase